MDDAKPFASLTPSLLARKGAAKPAMRSQYQATAWAEPDALDPVTEAAQNDLGWNDLGEDAAMPVPAKVLHMPPPVVRQREALTVALGAQRPSVVERRSAFEQGRRAAFTLRVDAERHLRLRMACIVQNRSAQQLVTEALDRVLSEIEGLEDLTRRARSH